MIQFIAKPTTIAFAGNPITFHFKAINPVDSLPFRALGERSVLSVSSLAVGDLITVVFYAPDGASTSLDFEAKATPISDTDIPVDLNEAAVKIQAHYLIAPYLTIYFNDTANELTAEAKTVEPNWVVELTSSVLTNTTESFEYTPINTPDGYTIEYQVLFEEQYKQGLWRLAHKGTMKPHEDGSDIYLNISDILNQECKASLKENPFAHYSNTTPVLTDNRRRYYVRFQEKWTTATPIWITENIRMAVMGGIPNQNWLSFDNWFLMSGAEKPRTWLTYHPSVQNVRFNTIHWISWYNAQTTADLSISLSVKTIDNTGTESGWEIVESSTIIVQTYQTITFPISPNALGLSLNAKGYMIKVVGTDSNMDLSSEKYFLIDKLPRRNIKQLAYINSFGCPEVITCTGEYAHTVSTETTQTETVRGYNHGGAITKTNSNINSVGIGLIYRSGIINAKMKEALSEIALSPVLFDITTPQYLALILKAEKLNNELTGATDEHLYSWEWATQPRININAFAIDTVLRSTNALLESNYDNAGFTTDIDTGGGTITTPLRYVKVDNLTSDTLSLPGITITNSTERSRMRFYRGNFEIFLDGDITIEAGDTIRFTLPFDNETFRAYY